MDRRTFLGGMMLATLSTPLRADAQQMARTSRIGVLGQTPMNPSLDGAFKQGLGQFGYTDGRNLVIAYRQGEGARLSDVAGELVRMNVDVIYARGPAAVKAAKEATRTIPVVAIDLESDPVAAGFVRGLAQPGGNITGVFLDLPELGGKQLQLLKEIVPELSRVAVLGDPVLNAPQFQATEVAARTMAIHLQSLEIRTPKDFKGALETAGRGRARAVLLLSSPLVFTHRTQIGALAVEKRLPAVSMFVEFAEAGGLMAYGPSLRESFQRCGAYVGRILQGAKPAELPVERPERFELVINLKTAKALGLAIPPSVLGRADQVIQ
jgi:putative tryptophan/tyrosine transport system substrate-binding protein